MCTVCAEKNTNVCTEINSDTFSKSVDLSVCGLDGNISIAIGVTAMKMKFCTGR